MIKKLIDISDLTKEDIEEIFDNIKKLRNTNNDSLMGKSIGMIFEKYSTRTRISFQVGISQLKGNAIDLNFENLNIKRNETFEDTFRIFSCYLDALVYRTDDHNKIKMGFKYFQKPIINALSDQSHPCQALSDIYTIKEHFNFKDNEPFTISWLGDVNNVLFSLYQCLDFMPKMKLNIITNKKIHENDKRFIEKNNVSFHYGIQSSVLTDSHCVMTDVYNSMNDIYDKESELKFLQVNSEIMEKTGSDTVFMHCLPANINSEVTEYVIYGSKSIVFKQAENRLHSQKGILKWLNI